MRVFVISLGCPKNLTDTEVLMGSFCHAGHTFTNNIKEAEIILINTCAFIGEARKEAFSTIKEAANYKKQGHCKLLYIAGCLPVVAKEELLNIKGIDGILESARNNLFDHKTLRIKATPPHTAYIKIADGCNNRCSYCSIPKIRGKLRSRPIEDILAEARLLAKQGVKELIYVAQDTTAYGIDLYQQPKFSELLKKTCGINELKWIRILYAHPDHIDDKLIKLIAGEQKIVKYLDLPIQHICDKILKLMRRRITSARILELIYKIRRAVPEITLRTSLIVGFPGETKADFNELLEFVRETKFERLGVFRYSKEKGTPAAKLKGFALASKRTKNKRFDQIMRIQNRISKEKNKKLVGKMLEVLVENKIKRGFLGRSYMDAPEIDGSVQIKTNKRLCPGDFVTAKVTSASAYDLSADLVTCT